MEASLHRYCYIKHESTEIRDCDLYICLLPICYFLRFVHCLLSFKQMEVENRCIFKVS